MSTPEAGRPSPDAVVDGGATARPELLRSGVLVGALTAISRVLGLVRDVVIAHYFGSRAEADAFFVAFKIPNLFRRLSAEGAFSQGFVPVLAEVRHASSEEETRAFIARTSGALGTGLALFTLLGVLGAELLISVFAAGFGPEDPRHQLASDMLRWTFPYLLLISLVALSSGVLNSWGRFAVPAFTPVWLNVCLIVAVIGFSGALDQPAMALAWGVLTAGIVQLLFQFPFLARVRMLALPRLEPRDPMLRKVLRLMGPAAFGASVAQVNLVIDTLLASFLVAGSISWLYYADRLMELPLGVFAIALSTVLLPGLSRSHVEKDDAGFRRALDRALELGLLVVIPSAAALFLLAEPLLATLFQYGAMLDSDVEAAAGALRAYALGLIGFSCVKILAPGFFARQDTKTPVRIGIRALGLNLVLNLALIGPLAHVGLALATSIAALVNAGLLARALSMEGVWHPTAALGREVLRIVAAAAAMGMTVAMMAPDTQWWLDADVASRVGWLAALVVLGVCSYFLALALLGRTPQALLRRLR